MIRFSKNYSKLKNPVFTTIRKYSSHYLVGSTHKIRARTYSKIIDDMEIIIIKNFVAKIIISERIKKEEITDEIAYKDADCSKNELIKMLNKWYGKKFDDFVLLTLEKL